MNQVVYVVHGTNDPIDGDDVVFTSKSEALNYAYGFQDPAVTVDYVYLIDGIATDRVQIMGPEVDKLVANSDENHNSCRDIDCPLGSEMNPIMTADDMEESVKPAVKHAIDVFMVTEALPAEVVQDLVDDEEEAVHEYEKALVKNSDKLDSTEKSVLKKIKGDEEKHIKEINDNIELEEEMSGDEPMGYESAVEVVAKLTPNQVFALLSSFEAPEDDLPVEENLQEDVAGSVNPIYLVIGCTGGELGFVTAADEQSAYEKAVEQWPEYEVCGHYLDKEFMELMEVSEDEVIDNGDLDALLKDGICEFKLHEAQCPEYKVVSHDDEEHEKLVKAEKDLKKQAYYQAVADKICCDECEDCE